METSDRQALPPLFPRHVRRPRLTRLLDETRAQVIVLTAPAGYGKTTLAAEWLQGRPNVAWYRSTPASADVVEFAREFTRSISAVVPVSTRLERQLRVPHPPRDPARKFAEILADEVTSWPQGARLVLDDYHLAASRTVDRMIDWLIELSSIRFVVTTRSRPPWLTARRLLHGDVLELGRSHLAMNPDEAAAVLRGLSRSAARALLDSAEGWPALIGLGALAARGSIPKDDVGRTLYSYLADEVWRRQAQPTQDFMVSAAVLPRLEADACRAIIGEARADELLADLKARGLVDNFGGMDHFHPLLRDFLLQRLNERAGDKQIYVDSAISYYCEHRAWDEAFDVALTGGNRGVAADIASVAARDLLRQGRVETLEKWLAACGPAALQPSAQIARCHVLIRRGRLAEARAITGQVHSQVPADSSHAAHVLLLAGQASHLASDYRAAYAYHSQAREAAHEQITINEALWGLLIAAIELNDPLLDQHFLDFAAAAGEDLDAQLRVEIARLLISERRGSLESVWTLASPTIELAHHASDPMIASNALVNFALANGLRGDFATEDVLAGRAVDLASAMDLDFAYGFALVARAEAYAGLRELERARQLESGLQRISSRHEDPQLAIDCEILRLKIAITSTRAEAPNPTIDLRARDLPSNPQAEHLAFLAIVTAASGDTGSSRGLVEEASSLASTAAVVHLSRCAELVAAEIDGGVTSTEVGSVLQSLETADCLGCFVWAYRARPSLLSRIRPGSAAAFVAAKAVTSANDQKHAIESGSWFQPLLTDPLSVLSAREREVHALLLQGMSNMDIADQLVISRNTAKVHVRNVLQKLGLTSRFDVLKRASG